MYPSAPVAAQRRLARRVDRLNLAARSVSMGEILLNSIVLLAALGSGLIAGVFFAFSAFVMAALARLPAPQGITAMQSINIVVLNRAFLGVFLGTAVACLVLAVVSIVNWREPGATWPASGRRALSRWLGVGHDRVQRAAQHALAAADADSAAGAALWARYFAEWTAWNHVRAAASLAAAGAFSVALLRTNL
jgi:uncharacterized membrane protein